ncbi:tail tube terminator protein [Salmonella phage polluks]|uniref:Tail tube terminator protein n=1 Tax=Salmonella phage polluks TaxID=2713313 RepID=A0A6G8RG14_9CAUD|nr:tail tube terminator protein [Salmonella phage polluks]
MDHRTSIAQAVVDRIATQMDGSQPDEYFNNLYGNVSRQTYKFEEIREFPYVAVHIGTETGQYLPSGQQWMFLELPILVYDKEKTDIQEQLEKLVADIKTVIDTGGNLEYTVSKPNGSTFPCEATDMSITSVGLLAPYLAPYGLAEINVTVRYQPPRRALRR